MRFTYSYDLKQALGLFGRQKCINFRHGPPFVRALALILFLSLPALSESAAESDKCQPFSESVTPQEIIAFVQDSPNLTVEDILCKLPKRLRSSYTIQFFSEIGAAQGASLVAPRVHLFDDNMVLTFNGNSHQEGGNEIEMGFVSSSRWHDAAIVDLLLAGPQPEVRRPGKLGCYGCHRSTEANSTGVRFLFNAAPTWMGFFGFDGFGYDTNYSKEYYEKEKTAFQIFKDIARLHPRYKYLIGLQQKVLSVSELPPREQSSPIRPGEGGAQITTDQFNLHRKRVLGVSNLQYSIVLAKLNHQRLIPLIMNSPDYDKYRFAILGAAMDCNSESITAFLPPDVQKYHLNDAYLFPFLRGSLTDVMILNAEKEDHLRKILDLSSQPMSLGFDYRQGPRGRFEELHPFSRFHKLIREAPAGAQFNKFEIDSSIREEFYSFDQLIHAELRYLFEGRLNPVSMREWSIDPRKGYYRFNDNVAVDDDLTGLAPQLIRYDPVIAHFFAGHPEFRPKMKIQFRDDSNGDEAVCSAIKQKSLAALANYYPVVTTPKAEAGYQLLTRECRTCHTQGVLHAPRFDFSNQKNFETFVTKNAGLIGEAICDRISRKEHMKGAMPVVGPLLPTEIDAIRAYMRTLGVTASSCNVNGPIP